MTKPHSRLTNFSVDYKNLGPSVTLAKGAAGQSLIKTLLSHDAICALIAVIDAAPSRPPHPALERYLSAGVGPAYSDDAMKVLCGRVVRQIVEELGGVWVRSGVPVKVTSKFANGSIYRWA